MAWSRWAIVILFTVEKRSARIMWMTKKNTYLKTDKDKEIYYFLINFNFKVLKKNKSELSYIENHYNKIKTLNWATNF